MLNVVSTEAQAREIAEYRAQAAKDKRAAAGAATTLDQLLAKAKADESVAELPIVVKADVQGSAEAIIQAMEKIGNEEVRVRVLHHGVGAITESDVGLAEASGAPVIGFNVSGQCARAQLGQPEGRRDPLLLGDLRPRGRREGSGLGPAGRGSARELHRLCRDQGDVPRLRRRHGRRLSS